MKKKIVIPSEEDVTRFGGESGSAQSPAEQPDDSRPDEQAASDSARPAPDADVSPDILKAEMEQWKDKCLRARAEMANYQRRVEKDRVEALRYANASLAKSLLPILDDLERIVAAAAGHKSDPDALVGGAKLTLENFTKVLKDFGVQPIEATGKPFDPNQHDALMQQPSSEHAEPTVLTEVAKGYRLHDRVLRPARVIVSKPAEPAAGGDSQEGKPEE
jgi:molecular chaperone GrpE